MSDQYCDDEGTCPQLGPGNGYNINSYLHKNACAL